MSLSAKRFLQIVKIINESLITELKQEAINHSFTAWQINETVISLFDEKYKGISFNKYIERMGLVEKDENENVNTKLLAQENIRIAEEIKSLDKLRGEIIEH